MAQQKSELIPHRGEGFILPKATNTSVKEIIQLLSLFVGLLNGYSNCYNGMLVVRFPIPDSAKLLSCCLVHSLLLLFSLLKGELRLLSGWITLTGQAGWQNDAAEITGTGCPLALDGMEFL